MFAMRRGVPAFAVLCAAFGLAGGATAAAPPVSPDFFRSATRNGTLHQGASLHEATTGFVAFHATTCAEYNPTSGGPTYLFIYPQEGGYIFTDSPYNQVLIAPECAANNVMGVDVYDSNGDWHNIYAFSHN